jgi:hypothetical protein
MKLLKINLLLILLFLIFSAPHHYSGHNTIISDNSSMTSRTYCFQFTGTSIMCKADGFLSNILCPGIQHNITTGPCDFGKPTGEWKLYTIMSAPPYTLYSADTTTGDISVIGNVTGIASGHSASGITWDYKTGTMFISSTDASQSRIYTLNIQTLYAAMVGSPITIAPALYAIDANPAGTIFGIDISNDKVYRINKTTGNVLLVGSIGANMNTGIDSDFDPRDGIFYTYIFQSNMFQLRSVDTSTGLSTMVGQTSSLSGVTGITFSPAGVIGIQPAGNVPEKYYLNQNYPNPFNPSTIITYGLPEKEAVQISVFDAAGKEILKLNEGTRIPGIYSLTFDGTDLPSGVYFFKITAGEFTDAIKMVLIK